MKRGLPVNSHQSNGSCKFNSLIQDYLDLQKENVRKKRKIQSVKQKIETLAREVRFLRQRYEYLINSHSVANENGMGQEGKGKVIPTNQLMKIKVEKVDCRRRFSS